MATLDLYRLTFTSYPDLVRAAQILPRLRHLQCSEIEFKNPADPSFSMSTFGRLPLFNLEVGGRVLSIYACRRVVSNRV